MPPKTEFIAKLVYEKPPDWITIEEYSIRRLQYILIFKMKSYCEINSDVMTIRMSGDGAIAILNELDLV